MKFPSIQELKHEHFAGLEVHAHKPLYEAIKRLLDFIFSLSFLVLLSPLWLLLIVLIHLDSKGNAVFTHTRIGQNGKHFTLYKFRTMYHGVKDQELAPES